jgi:agmatinase
MLYTAKTFEYESSLKEADVALLGIPFSSTETGQCVKHGPLFIREAIKNIVGYDPETKTNPFEATKFCDLGDVSVVPGSWKLTAEAITDTINEMIQTNPRIFPVFLGGEHLVTLAISNALAKHHASDNRKLTIIDFDAHRDLMQDWMGEKYSHITWAARALESPSIRLIQLGCRSANKGEWEPYKGKVMESLDELKDSDDPVYITIDMDVFDPSIAPEVGTPEPRGMNQQQFFEFLEKACKFNVIGMDIVECASRQVNSRTALMAAHIFKKVMIWSNM